MTRSVYIASTEGQTGKAAVALGLLDALVSQGKSVGVYRPIVNDPSHDEIGDALRSVSGVARPPAGADGVSYAQAHGDLDSALATIVDQFADVEAKELDVVVVVGSDWNDVSTTTELEVNARVACNLNAPVILVVRGWTRTPAEVRQAAENAIRCFTDEHNSILAVVANRCAPDQIDAVAEALDGLAPFVAAIPEDSVLSAPTVEAQFDAINASVINGTPERLERESQHVLTSSMTLPNFLTYMKPETTVIVGGDRTDFITGLLDQASDQLAAMIMVGDFPIEATVQDRIKGSDLPVATSELDSFTTASRVFRLFGSISPDQPRKIQAAGEAFRRYIDAPALGQAIVESQSTIVTPLRFEHQLQAMAAADLKTIVLPESSDERILETAAIIAEKGFAKIILLGEADDVHARAQEKGWDLGDTQIISPDDPELVEKFAAKYAELRAKKGVTVEQARAKLKDLSYFGTMMIYFGMADGMVSGAVNTTANTIRPSFEFIKTKPGISVVSSTFLMCMPDRVLAFGDCAVNPNPTPEQLAEIAISSAETAKRFGIEPRVAMLSYSTGTSGKGADVDAVVEATKIAKERAPELKLDGPIQFDAAINPAVGTKKMPGSEVAGQATVFIFPDLNTGNNTYKAVQRSSGALAVGPVLQGLNKPVNDLSRGALVADIVNTVAITAIQAQDDAAPTEGAPA